MDRLTNNSEPLVGDLILVSPLSEAVIGVIDVIAAVALLAFLLPLLLVLAVCVYISDPGPIFFAQRRLGRGGVMFPCFKFRSMVVDAAERLNELLATDPAAKAEWDRDHKLRNDPRVTRLGNILRKTSLDELPQLFNVVRRDMSLVGPRPISTAEAVRYGRHIKEYASVRPGITGLWQVSGRNDVSYDERVALDVSFVESYSVMLYLRIALSTVPAVILSRGSY